MLSTKLKESAGNGADATLYVNDVFSTYLYTGNGSTQTITNGIDLAGKGGLVWIKDRTAVNQHFLFDSARGVTNYLCSSRTGAQNEFGASSDMLTAFNSSGFSLGADVAGRVNVSPDNFASWTFRKAAKFFDVVTYTGTGGVQNIAHNLGSVPAMIIVKRTDSSTNWAVYHRSLGNNGSLILNNTAAADAYSSLWNSTTPTTTQFTVNSGNAQVGGTGGTCVAYLFAHDTAADGIIQCGSVSATGSTLAEVNLGWEPQWLLIKGADINCNWSIIDSMRGFTADKGISWLFANASNAEGATSALNIPGLYLTSTGFKINSNETPNNGTGTYIYMAIRMPNKPPTSGTQVFQRLTRSGGFPGVETAGVGPWDTFIDKFFGSTGNWFFGDRLRGKSLYLSSNSTNAETTDANSFVGYDVQNGYTLGSTLAADSIIQYFLKRAPGFFDVVCYTGTGSATTQAHNLGVVPELIIAKSRSSGQDWGGLRKQIDGNYAFGMSVNRSDALQYGSGGSFSANDLGLSTTAFNPQFFENSTGSSVNTNNSAGQTYVAYLFATLAGISKVGNYTGNGSSQNIECGFAAGARFFLVKATSTTGSWWVWDSARGITAGNDPALQLNSTAAEITTADAVDPYSPGITVNQEATCSINASGVSYIFLAVA